MVPGPSFMEKGSGRMSDAEKELTTEELKEYLTRLEDGQVVHVNIDELKEKKDGGDNRK